MSQRIFRIFGELRTDGQYILVFQSYIFLLAFPDPHLFLALIDVIVFRSCGIFAIHIHTPSDTCITSSNCRSIPCNSLPNSGSGANFAGSKAPIITRERIRTPSIDNPFELRKSLIWIFFCFKILSNCKFKTVSI